MGAEDETGLEPGSLREHGEEACRRRAAVDHAQAQRLLTGQHEGVVPGHGLRVDLAPGSVLPPHREQVVPGDAQLACLVALQQAFGLQRDERLRAGLQLLEASLPALTRAGPLVPLSHARPLDAREETPARDGSDDRADRREIGLSAEDDVLPHEGTGQVVGSGLLGHLRGTDAAEREQGEEREGETHSGSSEGCHCSAECALGSGSGRT